MILAYADESGDRGLAGSRTFVLAAVMLPATAWPATFDDLIDFRRFLKANFRLPVRAEVKANHLIQGTGAFRPLKLTEAARYRLYREHMRLQPKLGLETFAIVVDKQRLAKQNAGADARAVCWDWFLQRLERRSTKSGVPIMLIHDEGEPLLVRGFARKARRAGTAGSAFGTGLLNRPAKLLIDDPVPRNSGQSYFIQLADLNAYAAYRRCFAPPPLKVQSIVPTGMWDELGAARYTPVHSQAGSQYPGIVLGP